MEELNLLDLECPEPFMKVAAKLMKMKQGRLKILFKDPKCDDMIMEAVKLMDCKVLEHRSQEGTYVLVLEKNPSSSNENKVQELGGC
ncbi:sulfurtransferase TusA family protein [Metallosphaera hakonensis]|uniref:Sulfurtransferase TusA family protein n=1 Tax=Metallosphaera hakonensis JCM 8857 = DSM 7519 TaxID=1293036 RepID=A0A2U9IVQ5_9CREN|nr:sulfurtransferase TusA family protein [Metallosphaera hakonensis]AWS00109.1 sulfurtransferase TusA family protein [Metallosphaera hakonensis JCM 8857 = DSM 7519]